MKINKYTVIALTAMSMSVVSCDFLDREPLDFGNKESFYQTDEDLEIAVNDFYELFPTNKELWGGLYTEDITSDNQCSTSAQNLFYQGDKKTVDVSSSEWNFESLRGINDFINTTEEKYSSITGSAELKAHYLGEGYFFRAYDYFRLLRNFGDVPMITSVLSDDATELTAASKRYPRNEIARFILIQCDSAASKMQTTPPESGRLCRDAALALKARVALYEATWEKYHAGTCFVPGNSKWVGASTWPDFSFPSGNAEAEVNFFLDQAIAAAEEVSDNRALDSDYAAMFNTATVFGSTDEVILARYYMSGVLTHSCSTYLKGGGGCGITRAAVNTYLMANGLPIYVDGSGYGGTYKEYGYTDPEALTYFELMDRDERLENSVRPAGRIINTSLVDGKYVNDTVFYYRPYIYSGGNEKATTGYEMTKWCSSETSQQLQYGCTTSVPLFRAAETRLVYMEAYYLRYGTLGGKCDQYWRELRRRAGVNEDYQATINATVLASENDLGVYSRGAEVDATLYNIRRERRCELLAEGLRLDDLKRWRSLDSMVDYQPEGFKLWVEMYKMYDSGQIGSDVVSQSGVSDYIHPLQINATSLAYGGYNFPKPHYLEPIPISEFLLTGGIGNSTIYQNPGWPSAADGTADYTYDCD